MCIDFSFDGPKSFMCIDFFLLMAQKISRASIFSFDGPKSFMCIDFFVLMTSCASIFLC